MSGGADKTNTRVYGTSGTAGRVDRLKPKYETDIRSVVEFFQRVEVVGGSAIRDRFELVNARSSVRALATAVNKVKP